MTTTQDPDVVVTKPATRKSVTLTGQGEKLTILAQRKKDDTATVFVQTLNIKTKKTARGMTKQFESFDLAVEALGKLVKDAVAKGWKKTERTGGFKARPDAFTAMPAAPKGGTK